MAWTAPTVTDFKNFFTRDFPFGSDAEHVMDADISRAILEATVDFNVDLDDENHVVFMHLIAFHLVEDLKLSAKGVAAQAVFAASSKSVGGVSVSFTIPDQFARDPKIASYAANGYGMKYLSLVLPQLVGGGQVVRGTTTYG
jgi:hypothetical protein